MRRACALLSVLLLLLAAPDARAGDQVYRWVDAQERVHYGDRAPGNVTAGKVRTIPVPVEPSAVARLRVEAGDGEYLAWADNRLAGPIEVILRAGAGGDVPSDPLLPARASVPAGGSTLVARLRPPSGRSGNLQLRMEGVPGSSNARPRDVDYLPPLRGPARIDQGFGGSFSHDDEQNRHALDFAADIGTPVLAARAGTVMQAVEDSPVDGNLLRVLHADGSMAVYAHLQAGSLRVRQGQRVETGQTLAASGNSGRSSGPHLHFAVQANTGLALVSLPFRMAGPQGELRFPREASTSPNRL